MGLTIKDIFSTVVTIGVAWVTYANLQGLTLPFSQSTRLWLVILLVAGLLMCASTGTAVNEANKSVMIIIASALGVIAFLIFLWGIITGERLSIILLGADIVLLWAITTLRHILKA